MNQKLKNWLAAIALFAAWATVSEMDARDYELAHGIKQIASR